MFNFAHRTRDLDMNQSFFHPETKRTNAGVRRDLGALPRGYGKELKIAVPWKPGFKAFLNVTDRSVGGYCIDVFEAAVKKLPHHLSYKFVVFNGSYDELVQRVSSGVSLTYCACKS
jgi:hypothetical protein